MLKNNMISSLILNNFLINIIEEIQMRILRLIILRESI